MTARLFLTVAAASLLAVGASAQTKPAPAAQHDHDHGDQKAAGSPNDQLPTADYVERMLLGAPVNLRPATGVIRWKPDHTRRPPVFSSTGL